MTEFTVQCEGCGDNIPESEATYENVPGATLAWCAECSQPTYSEEVL